MTHPLGSTPQHVWGLCKVIGRLLLAAGCFASPVYQEQEYKQAELLAYRNKPIACAQYAFAAGDVPLDPDLRLQYTPLLDSQRHYYNIDLRSISLNGKSLAVSVVSNVHRTCCMLHLLVLALAIST